MCPPLKSSAGTGLFNNTSLSVTLFIAHIIELSHNYSACVTQPSIPSKCFLYGIMYAPPVTDENTPS